MQEAFGGINYVDRPNIGQCKVCNEGIFFDEDMTVDQIKIHKRCFKCGICDYPLQIGYCARDPALEGRYGLYWYCNLEHMLWGPGRKAAELDKLKRGKKNLPMSPTSGAPLGSPLGSPTAGGGGPLGSPTGGSSPGGGGGVGGGNGGGGGGGGVSPGSAPSGQMSMLDMLAARKAAAAAAGGGGGGDSAGGGAAGGFGGTGGGTGGIGGAGPEGGFGGSGGPGGAGQGGEGGAGGQGGAIGVSSGVPGATGGAFGTGNEAGAGIKIIGEQTPTVGKCKICDTPIAMCDDITVDRILIHRNCFRCGICDGKLFPGSCARDQSLEPKYGLKWYCGMHMTLGPGKKAEEMDKAGKPKRF